MKNKKKEGIRIGSRVMVYEDPVTKLSPEGEAVVVAAYDRPHYYQVRFVSDGAIVDRFIRESDDLNPGGPVKTKKKTGRTTMTDPTPAACRRGE